MASLKENELEREKAEKSASGEEAKVDDTFECEYCGEVDTVDECGCLDDECGCVDTCLCD